MQGADTFTYISAMFVTDLIYMFIIINSSFGILFAYNFNNYAIPFDRMNWSIIIVIILGTCIWATSFVA